MGNPWELNSNWKHIALYNPNTFLLLPWAWRTRQSHEVYLDICNGGIRNPLHHTRLVFFLVTGHCKETQGKIKIENSHSKKKKTKEFYYNDQTHTRSQHSNKVSTWLSKQYDKIKKQLRRAKSLRKKQKHLSITSIEVAVGSHSHSNSCSRVQYLINNNILHKIAKELTNFSIGKLHVSSGSWIPSSILLLGRKEASFELELISNSESKNKQIFRWDVICPFICFSNCY